jgi:hypothetical protein
LAAPQRPPARPDDYALPQYIVDGTMLIVRLGVLELSGDNTNKPSE